MNFNQVFSEVVAAEEAIREIEQKINVAMDDLGRLHQDLTVRMSVSTTEAQDLYEKSQSVLKLEDEKNKKEDLINQKKSLLHPFLSSTRVKISYVHRGPAPHYYSQTWEMFYDNDSGVVIRPVR
jgi:hypothetical protein